MKKVLYIAFALVLALGLVIPLAGCGAGPGSNLASAGRILALDVADEPAPPAQPTSSTDKGDYEPGDTVAFTGSGFQAGETVNIEAVGDTNGSVLTATATADDSGAISGSLELPLVYEATYDVTATGASSGLVAKASFTDFIRLTIETPAVTLYVGETQSYIAVYAVGGGDKNLPVSGVPLDWSDTQGGTVSNPIPANGKTDSNGRASITYTAGSTAGSFLIKVKVTTNPLINDSEDVYIVPLTMTIHVKQSTLEEHQEGCEYGGALWHFVITQIVDDSLAPATITVYWDNGASADVPLDVMPGGNPTGGTAHYTTTANPGHIVTDATAVIYGKWTGEFNLSHAECAEKPCTGCLEITKELAIPPRAPLDLLDGTFIINVAGPSSYSQDVSFVMEDGEIVSDNPVTLCDLDGGTYTLTEAEMVPDWWSAPDLPVDVEVSCDETTAVTVTNDYEGPVEDLAVDKTVNTSYTRTHYWAIDKAVTTENGYTENGFPKLWLSADGKGDETATWTVDVTYGDYKDTDHKVFGQVTITNTGGVDATINSVEDLLAGTAIDVDWGEEVEFPYTLAAGGTLVGTYSEDVASKIEGDNEVTVFTKYNPDGYYFAKPIEWGDPTTEVNKTVTVKDLSDLFGEVELGTATAPDNEQFTYTKDFAWADYGPANCGAHTYYDTATIVETGQTADATLKVNVQCPRPSGGKTLGFWSNKNGQALFGADDLALMVSLNLRNANGSHFNPASYSQFRTWLLSATATNMAYMLSAQLAAMELNVLNGFVRGDAYYIPYGGTIGGLMAEANASLGLYGNTPAGHPQRAYQEKLMKYLDALNNGALVYYW